MSSDPFVLGSCVVFPAPRLIRQLSDESAEVQLPPRIMRVLVGLAALAPETVSREELLDRGWTAADYVADEALTRAISDLRKAFQEIGCHGEMIRTVPKLGYRLVVAPAPYQETNQRVTRRPALPPVHTRPPSRRTAWHRATRALTLMGLAGIGLLISSVSIPAEEPQVHLVRRIMYPDPQTGEMVLFPGGLLDTTLAGQEADRVRAALGAEEHDTTRNMVQLPWPVNQSPPADSTDAEQAPTGQLAADTPTTHRGVPLIARPTDINASTGS